MTGSLGSEGTDTTWSEFEDRDFADWKRVRSAIEHENNLVNHRLTWLFLAQGGLFTIFASVGGNNCPSEATNFIKICVAIFGMLTCGFLFVPLREADKALVALHKWWYDRINNKQIQSHPPIQRRRMDLPWYFNLFQPQKFCFVFMTVWLVILSGLTGYGNEIKQFLNEQIRIGVILAIMSGIGMLIFMIRYPAEREDATKDGGDLPSSS